MRKFPWKKLCKESTIIYSLLDGDQLCNPEEIFLPGAATNTTPVYRLEKVMILSIVKTMELSLSNSVQITIDLGLSSDTLGDCLIEN